MEVTGYRSSTKEIIEPLAAIQAKLSEAQKWLLWGFVLGLKSEATIEHPQISEVNNHLKVGQNVSPATVHTTA